MTCEDPRLVVLSDQRTMLRGRLVTPALPVWPAKDPLVTTTRGVDFGPALRGRTIASVSYAATGATVQSGTLAGSVVTLTLSGGVVGTAGRVELRAICDDGTSEPAAVLLPIISLLTMAEVDLLSLGQAISGSPITTLDGDTLTTPQGDLLTT